MNVSTAEIAARIARCHRLRDLTVLWPDLSERNLQARRAYRVLAFVWRRLARVTANQR